MRQVNSNKRPSNDWLVLVGMAVAFTVPFILTLRTVARPRPLVTDLQANPTAHGYTWSLSLFAVPVMVLSAWLVRRHESRIQNEAFWITALLVASGGILLDVFFGLSFFTFPNRAAVLGLCFKGYSFTTAGKDRFQSKSLVSMFSAPWRSFCFISGAMNSGFPRITWTMHRDGILDCATSFPSILLRFCLHLRPFRWGCCTKSLVPTPTTMGFLATFFF